MSQHMLGTSTGVINVMTRRANNSIAWPKIDQAGEFKFNILLFPCRICRRISYHNVNHSLFSIMSSFLVKIQYLIYFPAICLSFIEKEPLEKKTKRNKCFRKKYYSTISFIIKRRRDHLIFGSQLSGRII